MRKIKYSSNESWRVTNNGEIKSGETVICTINQAMWNNAYVELTTDVESRANAKLMSKSPQMSEALIDYLRIMELNPSNANLYQRNKIRQLLIEAGIELLF